MAEDRAGPSLPIPISSVDDRYLLFDIEAITWLRKNHHICGVFIGSLPQNASQSVFMGLPMEIMPEEAQLLTELGVGYILDDAKAHDVAIAKANLQRQIDYTSQISSRAIAIAEEQAREKDFFKKKALKKVKANKEKESSRISAPSSEDASSEVLSRQDHAISESLFASAEASTPPSKMATDAQSLHYVTVTPTSSAALLPDHESKPAKGLLPGLSPRSYNLYRHLHNLPNKTYFMTPGLRFGCQFCVYPGDPLRFHSHFLATGVDWEEEIDLMDIVGGGRLGTGVKKGYLFGGRDAGKNEIRTFSVEWAAM